jgi:hypothetical protein
VSGSLSENRGPGRVWALRAQAINFRKDTHQWEKELFPMVAGPAVARGATGNAPLIELGGGRIRSKNLQVSA